MDVQKPPMQDFTRVYVSYKNTELYSEPRQKSNMEFFVKIVSILSQLFSQKLLSQMFAWVVNRLLKFTGDYPSKSVSNPHMEYEISNIFEDSTMHNAKHNEENNTKHK